MHKLKDWPIKQWLFNKPEGNNKATEQHFCTTMRINTQKFNLSWHEISLWENQTHEILFLASIRNQCNHEKY